jgi:hypothetical protein
MSDMSEKRLLVATLGALWGLILYGMAQIGFAVGISPAKNFLVAYVLATLGCIVMASWLGKRAWWFTSVLCGGQLLFASQAQEKDWKWAMFIMVLTCAYSTFMTHQSRASAIERRENAAMKRCADHAELNN